MNRKARRNRWVIEGCRVVLVVATCLFFHTQSYAQITFKGRNVPVEKIIDTIKKQTDYKFFIDPGVLEHSIPVNLNVRYAGIEQVMKTCAKNQSWRFEFDGSTVYIKRKQADTPASSVVHPAADTSAIIMVRVFDRDGVPLPDATVWSKRMHRGVSSDRDGIARITGTPFRDTLVVSFIGFDSVEKIMTKGQQAEIVLNPSPGQLNETVVMGYGRTTRRQSTGNVAVVGAAEIGGQAVSNPLMALEGRVPGLVITQVNGMSSAQVIVRVRGEGSIANGRDPLYIVDGVPFPNFSQSNIPSGSAAGSFSPVYLIAPGDIESIEILKDADATAIYGSRGANGVILITTKKRKTGDSLLHFQVSSGWSGVTRLLPTMNSRQYVQMRLEAFGNDGIKPDSRNAPDLFSWDTTRSTNWPKLLTGNVAHTTDVAATVSGGDANTQYLLGVNYHHESTVFPGRLADDRGTLHGNWRHISLNKRLVAHVTGLAGRDWNNQFINDLTSFNLLAPHAPGPLDADGNLVWGANGLSMTNPLAFTRDKYRAVSNNFLLNGFFSYRLFPGLTFQVSPGYNLLQTNETSLMPIASQDPSFSPTGSSYSASTMTYTWNLESQLEFKHALGKGWLTVLAGNTWQGERYTINMLSATGFTSDALLSMTSAAPVVTLQNQVTDYHYEGFYGRVNYNLGDKYLVNFTGRRDGSSRFGPGRQFGNFGALGVAWLFGNEKWIGGQWPFLSYGKVRGSYGITGNDQIGDYQYLDTWDNTTTRPYQGIPGFFPTSLANPRLAWELIRKLELALDLGFVHDRIFFTAAWYRHRSSNQLLPYALPFQTGFSSVLKNFPAVVQNSGLELTLRIQTIAGKNFQWTTTLNCTLPENKLISFPGLATSSSANNLVIGRSLDVIKGYRSLGVDPATGVTKFEDVDKNGKLDQNDWVVTGKMDLRFYGGINNSLRLKRWQLDIFLEKRVQTGADCQAAIYTRNAPGMEGPGQFSNQTTGALDRWQHAGDHARFQKFTTITSSAAGQAIPYLTRSSAMYVNAGFLRVKTISLSWQLPDSWKRILKETGGELFVRAQNLFTISPYSGSDPETQNFLSLPPMKTVAAGIQVNFK